MHRDIVEWDMQKSKPSLAPELYSSYKAYKTKESISKQSLYHLSKQIFKNSDMEKEITLQVICKKIHVEGFIEWNFF